MDVGSAGGGWVRLCRRMANVRVMVDSYMNLQHRIAMEIHIQVVSGWWGVMMVIVVVDAGGWYVLRETVC